MCETFSYVQNSDGDLYHLRPSVLHTGALGVVQVHAKSCPGEVMSVAG